MQWTVFFSALAIYLAVVRALRFKRLNAARARFQQLKLSSTRITPSTAQEIAHVALLYDMPFFARLGASAALFRTYGIPSIAETLLRTGEMSKDSTMSKRVTDTAILISSFVMCPLADPQDQSRPIPKDPRSSLAIARMNWIHSHYKISNVDFLYTMSMFIFQPAVIMERCSWRAVSQEEIECLFILWKEIGRRMGIEDIPSTAEALHAWSQEYELQHMIPSDASRALGQVAMNHIRRRVPNIPGLRRLVSSLFICLMDDRLRIAMMLPAQPVWAHWTAKVVCWARALFVKHCSLPRIWPVAYIALKNPPSGIGPDGRMRLYTLVRQFHPWYYPVPHGIRGFYDRIVKAAGWSRGFYPGAAFKAEGYRIEELGPLRYEEDGHSRVFSDAEAMQGEPIQAPWAR
ncbi:hypothetical protein DFH06DRAFT_1182805 [Mycena polygramma]|nr:hypothetical protein DFH06DRAFT_1182805 [Mycena polygramma]